jgi:DNA-binding response OmpR family regulator
MKQILVVEDDPAILQGLKISLEEENYHVIAVDDGLVGYETARKENLDLIILDLMLPGKNGQDVCSDLRKEGVETPILMLTSRKQETDKVLGLEMGADDYVTKPFGLPELKARIKALLRRRSPVRKEIEDDAFGDIRVDFRRQEAFRGKKALRLSSREFAIIKYLIQREGEVVSRQMLLTDIWGYKVQPTTRTVDNFILTLRKKIEKDPARPRHLLTLHAAGYKFIRNPQELKPETT